MEALNCAGGVQSGLVGAASCLRWMERTEAESRQKINILKVICSTEAILCCTRYTSSEKISFFLSVQFLFKN